MLKTKLNHRNKQAESTGVWLYSWCVPGSAVRVGLIAFNLVKVKLAAAARVALRDLDKSWR